MKNKIMGICICILLIAPTVSVVTSMKDNATNLTEPKIQQTPMAGNWTEIQKLLASDGKVGDDFSISVALSSGTALVGAELTDNTTGSAYVFIHSGPTWVQQAKLTASDGLMGDYFGCSVAVSGDTAVVGASGKNWSMGAVYVFFRSGSTWSQQAKLIASNGADDDRFGCSVAVSGDTILVGSENGYAGNGCVYVFIRSGVIWSQQAILVASDGAYDDEFGSAVSLSGDMAVVGAELATTTIANTGAVYVFGRSGSSWAQQSKLFALDGKMADHFGASIAVSVSDLTILVGADGCQTQTGAAYVFVYSGTTWVQQEKLLAPGGSPYETFGCSVSLSEGTALIGAHLANGDKGAAYVFKRSGSSWTFQTILEASDCQIGDEFGFSVVMSGDTALVGAVYGESGKGCVYVFTKVGVSYKIKGGVGVSLLIWNNGSIAQTVPWWISVSGGMFQGINKTNSGIVDIPAGKSKLVGTGLFFGLGPITIISDVAGQNLTKTGQQLLIFSMVKK